MGSSFLVIGKPSIIQSFLNFVIFLRSEGFEFRVTGTQACLANQWLLPIGFSFLFILNSLLEFLKHGSLEKTKDNFEWKKKKLMAGTNRSCWLEAKFGGIRAAFLFPWTLPRYSFGFDWYRSKSSSKLFLRSASVGLSLKIWYGLRISYHTKLYQLISVKSFDTLIIS